MIKQVKHVVLAQLQNCKANSIALIQFQRLLGMKGEGNIFSGNHKSFEGGIRGQFLGPGAVEDKLAGHSLVHSFDELKQKMSIRNHFYGV